VPLTLAYKIYIFPKLHELLQFHERWQFASQIIQPTRSGTKSKGGKQKAVVLLKTVEVARKIITATQPKKSAIQQ